MNLLLGFVGVTELLFIVLFCLLLPIIVLIDIIKSDFQGNNKLIWVLIVLFSNILGSVLYLLLGRDQKIKM